jgi:hypothetical protein
LEDYIHRVIRLLLGHKLLQLEMWRNVGVAVGLGYLNKTSGRSASIFSAVQSS